MSATAASTQSIVEERLMPHPPEKVWRALTQPALIAQWLMQKIACCEECGSAAALSPIERVPGPGKSQQFQQSRFRSGSLDARRWQDIPTNRGAICAGRPRTRDAQPALTAGNSRPCSSGLPRSTVIWRSKRTIPRDGGRSARPPELDGNKPPRFPGLRSKGARRHD
jgi:Activator of Hsp90 ATPase homolog 1-like protein